MMKICKKRKGIAELNLKNKFKNKRCFIVGNGPSLTVQDLDRLVGEDCFAANLIFKICFEKRRNLDLSMIFRNSDSHQVCQNR